LLQNSFQVNSKKYGVDLIRFSHNTSNAIHCSTKVDGKLNAGLMQVNGKAIAAFDPEGLIFAAGINNEQVKLYDLRSFDKGPFTTFKLEAERTCEWTGMTFSPCGKYIMINTNGTVIR
ncbi:hypothetical protein ANCCEY_10996, partial [Ancylostoma ceylanicum]